MSEPTVTRRVALAPDVDLLPLLGRNDDHLRALESELDVQIVARGHDIVLKGAASQVAKAERLLVQLAELVRAGTGVHGAEVRAALRMLADDAGADLKSIFSDAIVVPGRKKLVAPKSVNQKRYLEAVRKNDLVFAIGPAGTGKSYLGVAMAVAALMKRSVMRIVLTRPAVEAGERLGFLPGDLYEKVHPYLRPLYDALHDMLDAEKVSSLTEKGAIEIAPLAYMRGRTLNDAFIILDEAQNATSEQMKMFLTRLGFNSKMVVTGDITQVDLPSSRSSGLIEIQSVLKGVAGISFVYFGDKDVVRHRLVSAIVRAYDAHESARVTGSDGRAPAGPERGMAVHGAAESETPATSPEGAEGAEASEASPRRAGAPVRASDADPSGPSPDSRMAVSPVSRERAAAEVRAGTDREANPETIRAAANETTQPGAW
jgi:phosphate starvation-inducible PhoH-like protein